MHASDALSAILHQLFEHDTENQLIKFALPSHRANGQKLTTNFSELWQILMKCVELPNTGEIVILLDALDECKSESWKPLLEKLVKFYSQRPSDQPSKLKFLITSRPCDDIELQFSVYRTPFKYNHQESPLYYASSLLSKIRPGCCCSSKGSMSMQTKAYLTRPLTLHPKMATLILCSC